MAKTNNNENSSEGFGGLLILGLLGYSAFKSEDSDNDGTTFRN